MNSKLILASSSPYRQELLRRLRLPFVAIAPDVDENPRPGESPEALALRLAQAKAQVLAGQYPDALVIGADQVLDLEGEAVSKPMSPERAAAQLRRMSGQRLRFHTAVCVQRQNPAFLALRQVPVQVQVRHLSEDEIQAYLQAEPAHDCAGSIKSEGLGIALLDALDSSDPTAIIGLPLIATAQMLREAGLRLI